MFLKNINIIITAKKEGRINDEEITIFKSTGLAIQDVATAKLTYEKALAKGIGIKINI